MLALSGIVGKRVSYKQATGKTAAPSVGAEPV